MAQHLEFPHHVWVERSVAYGVEVALDFLPSESKGKWRRVVESSTERWVRSKGFKKPATLWMWGTTSISFNNIPGWSEFVVPVGLPKPFLIHLYRDLSNAFHQCVRFSESVQLLRDDGWAAICHVQDSIVWIEEDADLWVPLEQKEQGLAP